MANRRRSERRSYRLLDVHGSRRPDGACIAAPANSVADLVEMCATISYINSNTFKYRSSTRFSSLRANAVITVRVADHWRSQAFVVFRTLSGPLPSGVGTHGSPHYKAPGSLYALQVCATEPEDVYSRRLLSDNTAEESLHDAVRTVCALIDESLDPNSLSFKDAVSSRLRYFKRCNAMEIAKREATAHTAASASASSASDSGSDSEDAVHASGTASRSQDRPPEFAPPEFAPPPEPPPATSVPFQKPYFESVEDLFFSFATHVIDHPSGPGRPVDPLKPAHLVDKTGAAKSVPQPLVFCHRMCSTC